MFCTSVLSAPPLKSMLPALIIWMQLVPGSTGFALRFVVLISFCGDAAARYKTETVRTRWRRGLFRLCSRQCLHVSCYLYARTVCFIFSFFPHFFLMTSFACALAQPSRCLLPVMWQLIDTLAGARTRWTTKGTRLAYSCQPSAPKSPSRCVLACVRARKTQMEIRN